jgi:hypothetical protein
LFLHFKRNRNMQPAPNNSFKPTPAARLNSGVESQFPAFFLQQSLHQPESGVIHLTSVIQSTASHTLKTPKIYSHGYVCQPNVHVGISDVFLKTGGVCRFRAVFPCFIV